MSINFFLIVNPSQLLLLSTGEGYKRFALAGFCNMFCFGENQLWHTEVTAKKYAFTLQYQGRPMKLHHVGIVRDDISL
jgi:hypothetical protein